MRPIELTVKGLHSFREKQTVNFESLCEGGVFGIFGPTGSGKSSLLDAITLALYGKVERAAGSTQGILNHAEDELSVSLTFDLGIDEPTRYRVERVYKRSKSDGLTIGSCRFIRFDQGEMVVLADKERDVTQQVKDVLGLTLDDFTRAVVLPQGKFAEFLSLKGADRRRMLQRLFNMEKYGDRLNDVIKARLNRATNRLEAIQSGQQELGDASKEAVKLAEKAYKDAGEEVTQLSKQFQNMKETFENAKQKRDWQTALQTARDTERSLTAKMSEIDETRYQVKNARIAAQVIPYVQDYEVVEKALASSRAEKQEAETTFKEMSTLEDERKEVLETLAKRLQEETPIYEKRRESLRQAVQIHGELVDKKKVLTLLTEKRAQTKKGIEQKQVQVSELEGRRSQFQKDYDSCRAALKETSISSDQRELILKALGEKRDIENKQTSLNEWQGQWNNLQKRMEENEANATREKGQLDKVIEGLRSLFSRYEALYYNVSFTKKALDTVLDWLAQKEVDCQNSIQDLTIAYLAAELAGKLQEGAACPVCGATHHPEPAVSQASDRTAALKDELKFYKQCSQWLSRAITSAGSYQVTLEQRVNQIRNVSADLIPGIHSRKDQVLPDLSTWSMDDLKAWMTQTKDELQGFKQDYLALDERLQPLLDQYQKATQKFLVFSTQLDEYLKQENSVGEKINELKTSLEAERNAWTESYPHFDYQTIEKEQERLRQLDRKAHELGEKIESLNQQKEAMDRDKQQLDKEINEFNLQFVRFDENVKELDKALQILLMDYKKVMGDMEGEAAEALQFLEEEWSTLKENAAKIQEEWEKARAARFEAEKQLSNATALFKSTNKQAEEKGAALIEQLKRYSFSSPQSVKDASLSEDALAKKEETIKQFDQHINQIRTEIENLQTKIGPEPISDERFDSLTITFHELGEKRDQALEKRAAFQKEWESLVEKHERFMELEKERVEVAELESQLHKLASLFRGNGFVEYIAEEQMEQISRDASERLGKLTRRRYALEVDSGGGFVIRDDANGGIKRPVSSLSGGETFLTSLALALSLSAQIQLRGEVPLQFFFLDEGFGTLDQELLDTVITALEKLHTERMSIGVISHVPELQERLARKLYVEPAEPSGRGSRLRHAVM